jgi:N-acetylneuraminic acid mutarotase
MPTGRLGASSSVVDGQIYVIGGLGAPGASGVVEVYDPQTDSWTIKSPMPTARGLLTTSVVDGKIYAIGGNIGPGAWGTTLATVEMYDPDTDTWTVKASLPDARDSLASAVIDGKIYAIGGSQITGFERLDAFWTVDLYDPGTNTWTEATPLNRTRDTVSAEVVDGMIYAFGGAAPYQEGYDPTTDTWMKLAGMPSPLYSATTAATNGTIYVFGGIDEWAGGSSSTVFAYDLATDTWVTEAPMPYDAAAIDASVIDGTIYLVGGMSLEKYSPTYPPGLKSVWAYTP